MKNFTSTILIAIVALANLCVADTISAQKNAECLIQRSQQSVCGNDTDCLYEENLMLTCISLCSMYENTSTTVDCIITCPTKNQKVIQMLADQAKCVGATATDQGKNEKNEECLVQSQQQTVCEGNKDCLNEVASALACISLCSKYASKQVECVLQCPAANQKVKQLIADQAKCVQGTANKAEIAGESTNTQTLKFAGIMLGLSFLVF